MKRTAAVAGGAAKKAKSGPSVDEVVEAVRGFPPSEVNCMVASMLPIALSAFKDVRHDFQQKVVDMAEQALKAVEVDLVSTVQALEASVAEGPAEKGRRSAALSAATLASETAKEAAKQQKATLAEKTTAAKETQANLKSALAAQKDGDKELVGFESQLSKLREIQTKIEASAGDKKEAIAAVNKLKPFGFEESLLSSAPNSVGKQERGSFDVMVITHLDEAIKAKLNHFESLLSAGAAGREERAAVVAAAQAANDAAVAAREDASKANDDAHADANACDEAVISATAAVSNADADLLKAAKKLDNMVGRLAAFRRGALATFTELKEASTPVEESTSD